ncbi:energy-coupling factor ABC transporter ATP-binding protein [Pararhodospirillum photometricum]|nr:ATP-binding cassette domain-containing protein [Pararhodospirillum photometricum]
MSPALLLEARSLVHTYPGRDTPALDGLSLGVERGERLALLGPNGAGKTTLLLHLNGSLRPQDGEIRLAGEPQGYDRAALRRWRSRVQLVLQEPDDQLFAASVSEDVAFGPLNQGLDEREAEERVARVLEEFSLSALADQPPHLLSHGQRKRVAMAGAVAMRPDILILDEPTAGLDASGQMEMLAALERLNDDGTTLVFSTHDVDLAHAWADRVALFAQGRILALGPAQSVLRDPALLRAAALQPPMVVRLTHALQAAGWRDPETTPARDVEALARRLTPESLVVR